MNLNTCMNISRFKHGCDKAPVDVRDRLFAAPPLSGVLEPVDLRPLCSPVRNQGDIGSCTAFGSTELYDFVRKKHNLTNWTPSPLFTYYATRLMTNNVTNDSGALVKDAIKSTVTYGVAMERDWPYDTSMFAVNPLSAVWASAEKHQTLEYLKVNEYSKDAFVGCLTQGYPFAFGIVLFDSFFNNPHTWLRGKVKLPDFNTEKEVGGHCMLAVGYDVIDDEEVLIVQNSWGNAWGDNGFCYIPLTYVLSKYTFDFWTIRLTEACDTDVPDATLAPTEAPTEAPTDAPTSAPTEAPTPAPTPAPTQAPLIEYNIQPLPQVNNMKKFTVIAGCVLIAVILYVLLH